MIETTDQMTKVLGTPNKFAQLLRDAVIPMVSRLAPFQHAFMQRLAELGITYHGSPIVEGPGKRYFHESMQGGSGIRSHFLLVLEYEASRSTKAAAKELADSYNGVLELRSGRNRGMTLVRPDGYTAYSSHEVGAAALKHVQGLLERQTKTNSTVERKSA